MQTKKKRELRELLLDRKLLMINSRTYPITCYILVCPYEFITLVIGVIYHRVNKVEKKEYRRRKTEREMKKAENSCDLYFSLFVTYLQHTYKV